MAIGGRMRGARSAARSMIFRPRTDELAPRASICTLRSGRRIGPRRGDERARKRETEEEERRERERERERERKREGKVVA